MNQMALDPTEFDGFLQRAIDEDRGEGDITCKVVVPEDTRGEAVFVAKQDGVLAGLPMALRVFQLLEPSVRTEALVEDGAPCRAGQRLAVIVGLAQTLLEGERTALNLLQHLSGIATSTHRYVREVDGTRARIYDTRKTLPGMRRLEKYAVRMGGGANHRIGLYDMVLIKENHFAAASGTGEGTFEEDNPPIREIVEQAVQKTPEGFPIEVEARSLEEALVALDAGAGLIMLDNFTPEETVEAVKVLRERAGDREIEIESSGGITLETLRPYAEAGVDRIAIGAITHSAKALDIAQYFRRIA